MPALGVVPVPEGVDAVLVHVLRRPEIEPRIKLVYHGFILDHREHANEEGQDEDEANYKQLNNRSDHPQLPQKQREDVLWVFDLIKFAHG